MPELNGRCLNCKYGIIELDVEEGDSCVSYDQYCDKGYCKKFAAHGEECNRYKKHKQI